MTMIPSKSIFGCIQLFPKPTKTTLYTLKINGKRNQGYLRRLGTTSGPSSGQHPAQSYGENFVPFFDCRREINLLQILLVASEKRITRRWLRPIQPTIDNWISFIIPATADFI